MNKYYLTQAVKITIPVFFGYMAIGIPFGLMLTSNGYPWWLPVVMSCTMYAGAGQYIAVGMFAAGASLGTIVVAELFVNIRHIVYGLSLITKFKNTGKWKPYLIFALTDETYALLSGCEVPKGADPAVFYGFIALLDQLYWVGGTIIGAGAGSVLPCSFAGVDFALTALFAVLLIEQIMKSRDAIPPVIGIMTAGISVILSKRGILPSQHILLVALAAGLAVLVLVRGRNTASETSGEKDKQ